MNNILAQAKDFIKSYGWHSLFMHFFKITFLLLVIPLTIFSLIFFFSAHTQQKEDFKNVHQKNKTIIENIITETVKETAKLHQNNDCLSYITMHELDFSASSGYIMRLRQELNDYVSSSSYLESIYLYTPHTDYVITNISGAKASDFYDRQWLEYYQKTKSSNFCVSTTLTTSEYPKDIISIAQGLELYSNTYALMVYNIKASYLRDTLSSDRAATYLVSGETIIYTDDTAAARINPTEICSDYKHLNYNKNADFGRGGIITKLENNLFMITLPAPDISLTATAICIALVVLLIFLILIVSLYISIKFHTSIATILSMIEARNPQGSASDFNEIKYIRKNLTALITKRDSLENELLQKIVHLKKSQSVALQTQINPHFIFNTLGLANMIIMNTVKKPNDAEKVISLLSEFIFYMLDTKEYVVSFEEELAMTKKYIQIENMKHKNSFDIAYDIDDNVLDKAVIKLILQPIVENAFVHGLKCLESRKGRIQIKAYIHEEQIIIDVTNNGICIPPDKLSELRQRLNNANLPETRNIGLANVNSRIKIFYGDAFGITLDSSDAETRVRITLPTTGNLFENGSLYLGK